MNDKQRRHVKAWRDEGYSFTQISAKAKQIGLNKSASAIRHQLGAYKPKRKPRPTKPVVRKTERPGREDNRSILVISDMHVPFQHPDTVAFLTAVKKKYKPTRIVCIGDEIDQHNLSFHDTDPNMPGPADELRLAIKELQPIYQLFPVMDLIDSNHGSMLYRKGKHHGIPRKYLRDYGEVLDAPVGWKWQHDLTLDLPGGNKCYFHHGLNRDVMKIVNQRGVCVVQGHYHTTFNIGYSGNPQALLWGMNVGCSINGKSLAFAYDKTNLGRPIIGHGIIIDGQPKLLPMVLNSKGRWTRFVP
jgi:hypothetical protein